LRKQGELIRGERVLRRVLNSSSEFSVVHTGVSGPSGLGSCSAMASPT